MKIFINLVIVIRLNRRNKLALVTLHILYKYRTLMLLWSFSAFESYERAKHISEYTFENENIKILLRRLYASVTYVVYTFNLYTHMLAWAVGACM